MYDLIGDIHGHADELIQLLETLGYVKQRGIYRHPDRKVIFLGDFIDRGPQIREVLEIVRPMVESEAALSVIGNHEWNALAYHTLNPESAIGETLRPHSTKNVRQHRATIEQLSAADLASYLSWFRTLPIWLDATGFRVIHACWDETAFTEIAKGPPLKRAITDEFLHEACKPGNSLYDQVEIILKGREAELPNGIVFYDKEGIARSQMRTRWYLSPIGQTYRNYSLESSPIECDLELDSQVIAAAAPYPQAAKPLFIGHYWLKSKSPEILASNVACLDYSVAKGGYLCAYRWNGEQELNNANFVRTMSFRNAR